MIREIANRKPRTIESVDCDAFSVAEFCKRHRISTQLFYKLKSDMPPTFASVLVS